MVVVEAIVLADLPYEVFHLFRCRYQKSLLKLEKFFFDVFRQIYLELTGLGDQEELLVETGRRGKSDKLEHCVEAAIDLLLKSHTVLIVDD